MEEKKTFGSRLADIWNKTLNLKGDKVIVIIVLLLILISFLAIFSSFQVLTPVTGEEVSTRIWRGMR